MEIDHEIISTVILLLQLIYSRRVDVSYKQKYVHKLLVNRLLKPAQEKVWLSELTSDFIWDFRKLPFPSHLGKYLFKIGKISAKIHEIGKISAKIHEIGKIKVIFGLGMTPIYGLKNGQIKSLLTVPQ